MNAGTLRQGVLGNVKMVCVTDSMVYAVSGDSSIFAGNWVKAAWYVLVPDQKVEKGFLSENEFAEYINQQGYPAPQWVDIESVWKDFSNGKELPWRSK